MIHFYKENNGRLSEIPEIETGCWVNVVDPSLEELAWLVEHVRLDIDFLKAALDEEETSRSETENNQTLIMVDTPIAEKTGDNVIYSTIPIGIIVSEHYVVTVSLKENPVLAEFENGLVKNVQPYLKTRFVLMILLRISVKYLQYLKQIDKISRHIEKQLHRSMRNKELIQLLDLEKSLVFFSTSLKADEVTIEKILRGRTIKLYEEDQDLLEDVLVEIKQAIEMANIYSSILSGMMDAFASLISNNLNVVMKVLTAITILMAIPTMIFSFYGMNVGASSGGLPFAATWMIPTAIAGVLSLVVGIILYRKDMF